MLEMKQSIAVKKPSQMNSQTFITSQPEIVPRRIKIGLSALAGLCSSLNASRHMATHVAANNGFVSLCPSSKLTIGHLGFSHCCLSRKWA